MSFLHISAAGLILFVAIQQMQESAHLRRGGFIRNDEVP
jgi:hypothetical protein